MVGKKTLNIDAYGFNNAVTVRDDRDDQGYLVGRNGDMVRSSGYASIQDVRGGNVYNVWGSAQPGTLNIMIMLGDGGARTITTTSI